MIYGYINLEYVILGFFYEGYLTVVPDCCTAYRVLAVWRCTVVLPYPMYSRTVVAPPPVPCILA